MWKHEIISSMIQRTTQQGQESNVCSRLIPFLKSSECIHFESCEDLNRIQDRLAKNGALLFSAGDGEMLKLPFSNCLFTFPGETSGEKVAVLILNEERVGSYQAFLFGSVSGYFCWKIQPLACVFLGGKIYEAYALYNQGEVEKNKDLFFEHYKTKMATVHSGLVAIHAKNIFIEPVQPPEKLNRKRLKKGKIPHFKYHVLKFVPGKIVKKDVRGMGSGINAGSMPFHFRRGHFKTWTEENPMFNKPGRFGTFWCPDTAVGSLEKGFVDKDYKAVTA